MLKSLEALENIKREAGTPYFSTLYDDEQWRKDFEAVQKDLEVLDIILRCPFIIDSLQQLSKLPAQAKHRYTYGTITVRETEKVEEFFKNGESK